MNIPRNDHPRPQMVRDDWLSLNGEWGLDFDDENRGLAERWQYGREMAQRIVVPFAYQSALSGIGERRFHDVVWYARSFHVPESWYGRRVLLHFGAVDYRAQVWVNGELVAWHEGGHTPFCADITPVVAEENRLVVRVEDVGADREQPRGKQYWKEEPESIFYTGTTGIWQSVWLEPVGRAHIEQLFLTPDIDAGTLSVGYRLHGGGERQRVELEARLEGEVVAAEQAAVDGSTPMLSLPEPRLWSPEQPHLYDLTVRLWEDEELLDEVHGYFGMRKISVDEGQLRLNNRPYRMKLVLDQGYHPDGILTAPSDDALRRDVELAKEMGFNGVRKHQKVEEPRYLYWADRLGLLVWGEMANAHAFSERAAGRLMAEWQAAVERDYNHPCIVVWVPLNESWGVPALTTDERQRHHALALYHLTRSLDPTRLVIANDGWEHTRADICGIHDYEAVGEVLAARYRSLDNAIRSKPAGRLIYLPGFEHRGEPLLVTEFGGIAYQKGAQAGWGYSVARNDEEFASRYREVVTALASSPLLQGFCYTQFTDVEQEINGLLTYDRQPKIPLELLRAINEEA